jgi:hypothetical protein
MRVLLPEEGIMRTVHLPVFGLVLVVLTAAIAILPGTLTGDGGAKAEAFAAEEQSRTNSETAATSVANTEEMVANCRYGTAVQKDTDHQKWVDDLGAGWWLDFQANYVVPAENGAEYMHVIWTTQKKDAAGNYLNGYNVIPSIANNSLGYLLLSRPGRVWFVGNEVDRGPDPGQTHGGQGDMMPEMYARAYHDIYHYIKKWDPTALVAPSALVEVTPGRIQYLDRVVAAYENLYKRAMPVDLWNMHLYILPEMRRDGIPSYFANIALGTDPALGMLESFNPPIAGDCDPGNNVFCLSEHDSRPEFIAQVLRMRTWMKQHGYQDTPLIISEYSILLPYELRPPPEGCWVKDEYGDCFDPERVRDFAVDTFEYLETAADPALGYPRDNDRLVQQWLWYGVHRSTLGKASNLEVDGRDPFNMTLAGQAFHTAARAEPASINLMAEEAGVGTGRIDEDGGVTLRLSVAIRNNGNTRVNEPLMVTFYRDADLTEVIGTATLPAPDKDFVGMTGCAVRQLSVNGIFVVPEGLEVGEYPYWVQVNDPYSIVETDDSDNVVSGTFTVVPTGMFVPLVTRG